MRIQPPQSLTRRVIRGWVKWCAASVVLAQLALASPASPQPARGRSSSAPDDVQARPFGALTGFAFVGPDNAVRLGRSPTPPAGARAAEGAAVSVGSVSAKTDSAGAFTLKNVPAGTTVLHVATAAGATGDFAVTIFGGATAQLGAPAVTRAAALAAVRNALSSITTDPKVTIILGPQEPLPVGTTVAPVYGDDNGQPNAALNYTARTEQWFIYVDPNVLARFQHPVLFFFVDASTGKLTKLNETSWPLINGLSWYGSRDASVKSPDLLVTPQLPSGPRSAATAPLPSALASCVACPAEVRTVLR